MDNGDSAVAGRRADDWLAPSAWRGFDGARADIQPFCSSTKFDAVARDGIDGNIRLDWLERVDSTSNGKTAGRADIATAFWHCAAVSVAGIHLPPNQVYVDR